MNNFTYSGYVGNITFHESRNPNSQNKMIVRISMPIRPKKFEDKEQKPFWLSCTGYDSIVQKITNQGIDKGSFVVISGQLSANTYTSAQGETRTDLAMTIFDIMAGSGNVEKKPARPKKEESQTSSSNIFDDIPF